jgi:hypothetical protein
VAGARAAFDASKREQSRVLYCSAQLASSSASFLDPQSKGETEEALGEQLRARVSRSQR